MKNPTFRGVTKNQYKGGGGGLPKKVGLVQFANLRGACQERRGGVLEGGLIPQWTL